MIQRQADRHDFEKPQGDNESLALYAWAGIAAVSALMACFSLLVPVSEPPSKVAKNPKPPQLKTAVADPKPDIIPPKNSPLPVTVVAQKDTIISDLEVDELLEKYRESSSLSDPQTTGSVSEDIDEEILAANQLERSIPAEGVLGATIGLSGSVPELSQRYAALKRRAPDLFETIDPLVEVVDEGGQLKARLVAGPFAASEELSSFCRSLKLRITIDCTTGDYSGEPLTR